MTHRLPYDDDRPAPAGGGAPGRPPAPRTGSGGWNGDPVPPGRRPGPDPRPGPSTGGMPRTGGVPGQRRGEPAPDPRYRDLGPSDGWGDDESTQMIGKLGFVPREARRPEESPMPAAFDPDEQGGDDRKFRARKRAKKASPLAKLGVVALVVVIVAAIGGGVWWLFGTGDEETGSGLTYDALDKPCAALDVSPLSSVTDTGTVNPMREEVDPKQHKTTQVCEVTLGKDGVGGSVQVYAEVFPRDAGASNAFDHGAKDAEGSVSDTVSYEKLTGVGDGAFAVNRTPSADSSTVDYSLYLYDDNAYLYTRVSVYKDATVDEIAALAAQLAQDYLASWKG